MRQLVLFDKNLSNGLKFKVKELLDHASYIMIDNVMDLAAVFIAVEDKIDFDAEAILFIRFADVAAFLHLDEVLVELIAKKVYLLLRLLRLVCVPCQSSLHFNGINLCL